MNLVGVWGLGALEGAELPTYDSRNALSAIMNSGAENKNHLEERLLGQAQAQASYTPLVWGCSHTITQGMVSEV